VKWVASHVKSIIQFFIILLLIFLWVLNLIPKSISKWRGTVSLVLDHYKVCHAPTI
jgi:hypothetical protein